MPLLAAALLLLLPAGETPDPPVEQTKKNIKVLQGLPSSQLIPVMAFMSNSLGVTCAYCHTKQWESDEKPAKAAARRMIAMQREINARNYDGKPAVTCNSCHRGSVGTMPMPDVAAAGWNAKPATPVPTTTTAYLQLLPQTPAGIAKRVVRGTVERFSGRDAPVSAPFTLTLDGEKIAYDTTLSHPPEARRALTIYFIQPIAEEKLRGERWTADPATGLVARRQRETPTPLGVLPEEIDYADYRDAGGARLPYLARWSRADYRVTYTIDTIEVWPTPAKN